MLDDLTISIGTFENYEMVEKCLRSIHNNASQLKYRVCVVDNGSIDDSASRIETAFPWVTLIRAQTRLGFCGTHNLVFQQSQSRYVLVLDDDTIISQGTLEKMIEFMDGHPEVGMAGCKALNPDGTFQKSYGLVPNLKTEFLTALKISDFWPDRLYQDISSIREVEWINGPFMLVRSDILKEVGAFDEHYFTVVCEADWCYRIRKAGWKVMFVPEADIIHIGGLITKPKNYATQLRFYVNRYYFFHKHYNQTASMLLRPIMMIGALLRMGYFLLVGISQPKNRQEALKRVRIAWKLLGLSFSRTPYNFPKKVPNIS